MPTNAFAARRIAIFHTIPRKAVCDKVVNEDLHIPARSYDHLVVLRLYHFLIIVIKYVKGYTPIFE